MNQIAMRGMDLNDTKAGLAGPARRCGKSSDNFLDAIRSLVPAASDSCRRNANALGATTFFQPPSLSGIAP